MRRKSARSSVAAAGSVATGTAPRSAMLRNTRCRQQANQDRNHSRAFHTLILRLIDSRSEHLPTHQPDASGRFAARALSAAAEP